MTQVPTLTDPPAVPDRRDVSSFAIRAQAFVSWLVLLIPQLKIALSFIRDHSADAVLADTARLQAQQANDQVQSAKNSTSAFLLEAREIETSVRDIRDAVLAVSNSQSGVRMFSDYATASSADLSGVEVVEVQNDENYDGHRVRYLVGPNDSLTFLLDMDFATEEVVMQNLAISVQLFESQVSDRLKTIEI